VQSDRKHAPDVLGTSSVIESGLAFTPRFAFERGVTYELFVADESAGQFTFAADTPEPSTRVTLAPALESVPANLLKFYLSFSGPMRRGNAYEHVRLRDAAGNVIEEPFLIVQPELWNPERTRLTLFVEPGRIKRGVLLHEELGPVLTPERTYTLEVDAAWLDARGAPLATGLVHTFATGVADTRPPRPANWKLSEPAAGARAALQVEFDEALDRALVERLLHVEDAVGRPVQGASQLAADQRTWTFTPKAEWNAGNYTLIAPALLEDLVGNSIGKPFEVGPTTAHDAERQNEDRRIDFVVD